MASTDPFRGWIQVEVAYSTLVRQSSAIKLAKDPVLHQRSKHIELHMHFIKNLVHDHVLEMLYCPTDYQVVDIFTKSLTEAKFPKLRSMLEVQECVLKGG